MLNLYKMIADLQCTKYLKEKLDDSKARSKMSFKLKKEEDAKDIWAYLVSVSESKK